MEATAEASLAEMHILFDGYANEGDTPSVSRVASTVAFVREGDIRVIIDPGMVPDPASILVPLTALGESPATITDVIFSHHHPDHTLNAALFPRARFHDYWAIYQSSDGKTECPNGLNDGPREQFRVLFPDDGTKRTYVGTAMARESGSIRDSNPVSGRPKAC